MSIKQITDHVESVFNANLNGADSLEKIQLHFTLANDHMHMLIMEIEECCDLAILRKQPWIDPQMLTLVEDATKALLLNSKHIRADLEFIRKFPYHTADSIEKFKIYFEAMVEHTDSILLEQASGGMFAWFKKMFSGSRNEFSKRYYDLLTNQVKTPLLIEPTLTN